MDTLILNFSSRRDGNCYGLARLVKEILSGDVEIVDFCDLDVHPCGKCGYECFKGGPCPLAADGIPGIYERIAQAKQVVFLVPNYCGYPCGNFFAFNERGCSYFGNQRERLTKFLAAPKKFIAVSNSENESFLQAFSYLTGKQEPQILFLSSNAYGCSSLGGGLAKANGVKAALAQFLYT